MSAAVAAALKKIAAFILSDKELRGKAFVIIGSIICGFLGLLCLPVVAIASLGNLEIEPPEIDRSMFNEAAFIQNLSSDQQAQLANLQNQGQAIEDAMTTAEVGNQTIKGSSYTCLFGYCKCSSGEIGGSGNVSWAEKYEAAGGT